MQYKNSQFKNTLTIKKALLAFKMSRKVLILRLIARLKAVLKEEGRKTKGEKSIKVSYIRPHSPYMNY